MTFDAELANTRSELDRLRKESDALKSDVDGGKVNTDLGFDAFTGKNLKDLIIGKNVGKVEGGSIKIQIGASDTLVVLFKGELVTPGSTAVVFPIEYKKVMGFMQGRVGGTKKWVITGAKWDEIHGIKFERKGVKTIQLGTASEMKKEEKKLLNCDGKKELKSLAKYNVRECWGKFQKLQDEVKRLEARYAEIQGMYKDVKAKYESIKLKLKDGKIDVDGTYQVHATETITMKADNISVKAGEGKSMLILPNAQLRHKGSRLSCTGGVVTFKGGDYLFK